jgi:hypothetical protein
MTSKRTIPSEPEASAKRLSRSSLTLQARTGARGLTLFLLFAAAGCGGPETHPVQGKVVFKGEGQPVTGGWLTFEPTDAKARASAMGDIQKDGTFRLTTYRKNDGAPPGEYRVMIQSPMPDNPDKPPPPDFDRRYTRPETTTLKYTVKPGKNDFVIEVERAKR